MSETAPSESPEPEGGPTGPSPRDLLLWGIAILGILVIVGVSLFRVASEEIPPPPILGEVPVFSLVNRDGRTVTLADLGGSPWVADFIFTRCPAICPRMSQQMLKVQKALPAGSPVRLVSISIDPEHDTPEVLARYAEGLGAADSWLFLTGEAQEIYSLSLDGFKLPLDPTPPPDETAGPIVHSNRFVLVDAQGEIRGYYDPFDEADFARLLREMVRLVHEGQGVDA